MRIQDVTYDINPRKDGKYPKCPHCEQNLTTVHRIIDDVKWFEPRGSIEVC